MPEKVRLKWAANDPDAQVAASEEADKVQARIKVARKNTAASVALARAHHVPVLLVTQCRLLTDGSRSFHFEDHGLDELGRSLCGDGVYCLSMKDVFSPLPNARSYFSDSGHLKRSGHLLLAHAIIGRRQTNWQRPPHGIPKTNRRSLLNSATSSTPLTPWKPNLAT